MTRRWQSKPERLVNVKGIICCIIFTVKHSVALKNESIFSFALPMHSSCDLKQLQCNHLKSDWLNYKTGIGKKIFTLQSRINVAQMVFSENFNLVQLILLEK